MKYIVILATLLLPGCSFAVRAEVLNPLNKSGRVESSEPAPAPTPTPSPTPTPFECATSTTTDGVIVGRLFSVGCYSATPIPFECVPSGLLPCYPDPVNKTMCAK